MRKKATSVLFVRATQNRRMASEAEKHLLLYSNQQQIITPTLP
jgi:hypothetical protein